VPLIATFHSKYYEDYYAATKSKWLSKILNNLTMQFFSKAFALWTVSKATVKTIQNYGLSGRGIKVISNGTDIQAFDNPNPQKLIELQDKFRIDFKQKTILFVGQIIWQKNLKLIIDTLHELDHLNRRYQLVLVGEGRHQDAIQAYVQEKNMKNKVIFTGKITDNQTLSLLYKNADLFFFPSAYDNDPLVVKEAAVHALPTLVMKHTSIADQITDNVNGYIQSGNAKNFAKRITEILDRPSKRKKVGEQAQIDLVKRWPDTLRNLKKEYQSVIKKYYP
ncbi:MAG: glycosyltransferase, partial [Firmicutes bacterium]|nr:glycosyltransferase [Bacillota bacterium]